MFGLNKKIKGAFDRTYKKVIGKEYRDEMIKKNQDALHSALVNSNNQQDNFEFYSTSKETYNHEYKLYMKSLRSQVEKKAKSSEELSIVKIYTSGLIISAFFWILISFLWALISFMDDTGKIKSKLPDSNYYGYTAFFVITSIVVYFLRNHFLNKLTNLINEAKYEKEKIPSFFKKYKTAIGLSETFLLFIHQTSENIEDNRIEEVEYSSIQKVFLTAQGEEIEFKQKYITGEILPEKTIVETDEYKIAVVKILNLLMPDNTVLSIIDPSGPNGEDIKHLRNLIKIKTKMPLTIDQGN